MVAKTLEVLRTTDFEAWNRYCCCFFAAYSYWFSYTNYYTAMITIRLITKREKLSHIVFYYLHLNTTAINRILVVVVLFWRKWSIFLILWKRTDHCRVRVSKYCFTTKSIFICSMPTKFGIEVANFKPICSRILWIRIS